MVLSDDHRKIIVSQHQEGKTPMEIHNILKRFCSRATVYNIISGWIKNGHVQPKKRKAPRKSPSRILMENRVIRNLTIGAQQTSLREQAKKEEVGIATISRMLKKRGINVYKKKARNLASNAHKATRKLCCGIFRKKYRLADIPNFVFVDECYVVAGEYFNAQNERCYGKKFDCIPDRKRFREMPKSPVTAMIFGAVWRDGRSKLVVLKSGFRLNQHTYKDTCLVPLLRDLRNKIKQKDIILYQDKAPCHRASSVQSFLTKKRPPSFQMMIFHQIAQI